MRPEISWRLQTACQISHNYYTHIELHASRYIGKGDLNSTLDTFIIKSVIPICSYPILLIKFQHLNFFCCWIFQYSVFHRSYYSRTLLNFAGLKNCSSWINLIVTSCLRFFFHTPLVLLISGVFVRWWKGVNHFIFLSNALTSEQNFHIVPHWVGFWKFIGVQPSQKIGTSVVYVYAYFLSFHANTPWS